MAQSSFRIQLLVIALLLCGLSYTSRACNVPAFRYALERWPADLYQVVVYAESTPHGAELQLLQRNAGGRDGLANYSLKVVNVTEPEGKILAHERKISAFPWVEIYYPVQSGISAAVWSGPLNAGGGKRIVESPSRFRLVQSLMSGEVAVWVLLKSGQEAKDRRALDSLKISLEKAAATLRIPEIGTDLNGDPIAVTDFKTYPVHFAMMEIARDDPDEEMLVSALMKSEPDLERYDEPMAFPVFGRARALYALVGNGIQEKNILEACQSLINWCSCEIKASNPGTDLLVSADWSRPYGGKMVKDPELPLEGLSGFVPPKAPAVPREEAQAKAAEPGPVVCAAPPTAQRVGSSVTASVGTKGSSSALWRNTLYVAGGAGLVLLGLSVLVMVRKRR